MPLFRVFLLPFPRTHRVYHLGRLLSPLAHSVTDVLKGKTEETLVCILRVQVSPCCQFQCHLGYHEVVVSVSMLLYL
jgi:hypothetical protein